MNARVKTAIEHWSYVAPLLQPARNAKEYALLVEALDAAIDAGGADALRYLMQRDSLRQVDLPELGSQGVVSELLSGRREFNARQAK